MIRETLRLTSAAMANVTYGVNAQITTLDISVGDPTPPDVVTITDETQNIDVALDRPAVPMTSIGIVQAGPAELEVDDPQQIVRDGEVTVGIRYFAENSQTHNVKNQALYVMRAIEKTINDWMDESNLADRQQNNITVCFLTGMRHEKVMSYIEDSIIAGQLTVTFEVRDTAP